MKQVEKKCLLCEAPGFSRNLCQRCYMSERWRGTLDNFKLILTPVSLETRIKKTPTCWLWTGDRTTWGYGVITTGRGPTRRRTNAHRYAYKLLVGKIPPGKVVMHTCDTPACVNPKHLRLGTIGDNNRDTAIKRRHNFGLAHWNGKLSDEQVAAIRADARKQVVIAGEYGVSQSHISCIKGGTHRTWHTKPSEVSVERKLRKK